MTWRLWLQAIAVGLGLAAFSIAIYLISLPVVGHVFPYLVSRGFQPSEQLGYGQLYAAFLAIAITGTFGWFAVKQLELGRESIALDVAARQEAQKAEAKRILTALYLELSRNRIAGLHYEGRLRLARVPQPDDFAFRTNVFEAAIAGPLWSLPATDRLWRDLSDAYARSGKLGAEVHPWRWQKLLLAGPVIALVRHDWRGSTLAGGLIPALSRLVATSAGVIVSGEARLTREAIERAMCVLYSELTEGAQLCLDDLNRELDGDMEVLPERIPSRAEIILSRLPLANV